MCDGPCSKKVLLLLNGLFMICGAGLLGIGLWMKFDPMFSHYLHVVDVAASNSLIDVAAFLFIAVGALAFVIAFVGCCGAVKESQCLIFVYIVFLFVLIAGEIVGGVLAVVYRTEVEAHLEKEMAEQLMKDYAPDNEETFGAWNYLQTELQCCGAYNFTDYKESVWWNETRQSSPVNGSGVVQQVPDQCCVLASGDADKPVPKDWKMCNTDAATENVDSEFLHTKGCHDQLFQWFKNHSLILMCLGFGIAAVQLLGFLAACCFRKAMRSDSYTNKQV